MTEISRILERYERRNSLSADGENPISSWRMEYIAEKERMNALLLRKHLHKDLRDATLLEIGCGNGSNLLRLLALGFAPENLAGIELVPSRAMDARKNLPGLVSIREGDATQQIRDDESHDVVHFSTVMSSILDDSFQLELASRAWQAVKPGGGILWCDFVFNNPRNPDVRGVSKRRVQELFPQGQCEFHSVILAPPIARRLEPWPWAHRVLGLFPFLRTHVVGWIGKPQDPTMCLWASK